MLPLCDVYDVVFLIVGWIDFENLFHEKRLVLNQSIDMP